MAELTAKRRLVTTLAILVLVLTAGLYAAAQQMDESKRDRTVPVSGGKYHVLPATLETTQWGWLDPKEPPKLVVNSGDTVAVETMMHSHNKIQPGTTMEEIVALRKANPGRGPHPLTRPTYVNRADPGRTARKWTSTSSRKARGSTSRASSRAASSGRATPTAARATARSTSPRSSAPTGRS